MPKPELMWVRDFAESKLRFDDFDCTMCTISKERNPTRTNLPRVVERHNQSNDAHGEIGASEFQLATQRCLQLWHIRIQPDLQAKPR